MQAPLRQEELAKQRLLNESLESPELLNDEALTLTLTLTVTLTLSLSLSLTLTLTKAGEGADSSSEEREAERSPGTELKSRV